MEFFLRIVLYFMEREGHFHFGLVGGPWIGVGVELGEDFTGCHVVVRLLGQVASVDCAKNVGFVMEDTMWKIVLTKLYYKINYNTKHG